MRPKLRLSRRILVICGFGVSLVVTIAFLWPSSKAFGDPPTWFYQTFAGCGEEPPTCEPGGAWYWMRSPEQEKRVVIALFNRYCIRCHGVDGRGVWDIPDVPNFTNPRFQACRTDGELARAILEGRGSVMPPWRGALSLEEAWAIARYIRTFVPGTEVPRPDYNPPPAPGGPSIPPGGPSVPAPPPPAGTPRTTDIHSYAPKVVGASYQLSTPSNTPRIW
jgi:hypothetical protein